MIIGGCHQISQSQAVEVWGYFTFAAKALPSRLVVNSHWASEKTVISIRGRGLTYVGATGALMSEPFSIREAPMSEPSNIRECPHVYAI